MTKIRYEVHFKPVCGDDFEVCKKTDDVVEAIQYITSDLKKIQKWYNANAKAKDHYKLVIIKSIIK